MAAKPLNDAWRPIAGPSHVDDTIRGIPPGAAALAVAEVGAQGLRPADGMMSLPVLTLDENAFAANRELMLRYAREHGVAIAPHAKTPMCPALAISLLEAGAWGTTVADIRQASVMLKAGLDRLILANEVGGRGGARRLARLLATHPHAEFYVFADSPEAVTALADAWRCERPAATLGILVEVGAGRAGARDLAAAARVIQTIADLGAASRLVLAGVGAYEGVAAQPDPGRTKLAIDDLLGLVAETYRSVRDRVGPDRRLVVTAGGSGYFDWVVSRLQPVLAGDPHAMLVLRSGAIFFHDHGAYERALSALDARQGFVIGGQAMPAGRLFKPVLRVWAEVLSRPEPELALCGMGMRDVSFDQDLPRPLRVHRDGRPIIDVAWPNTMCVLKLNDQHSYLALDADSPVRVGDVVEFGISHPCTTLDRWRFIFGVNEDGRVAHAYPTCFG